MHHTAVEREDQRAVIEGAHLGRGYAEGCTGSHIAYHFSINSKGKIDQNRCPQERSIHTRCGLGMEQCLGDEKDINNESLAIVLEGDFTNHLPPPEQLTALQNLIAFIKAQYPSVTHVIPHREASATACPGKKLSDWLGAKYPQPKPEPPLHKAAPLPDDVWRITRYYSPIVGQPRYYMGKTYLEDVRMNCGLNKDGTAGDCYHTADGSDVRNYAPLTLAACPPSIPHGTKLKIEMYGIVECHDRGGAIKEKRIDLWAGLGMDGLAVLADKKYACPGGATKDGCPLKVEIMK